ACKSPKPGKESKIIHNHKQKIACLIFLLCIIGAEAELVTSFPSSTPGPLLGLGHKFKTPEGNWECKVCCLLNKAEDQNCVACQSEKPKAKIQFRSKVTLQDAFVEFWNQLING
ncbi:MAG: zinc finger Ran-binding domain-containing protein, partial [Plesiomonas shigelloides]